MPTRRVGSWENDTIVAELDYNVANQITAVRVINTSLIDAYVEATQINNGRTYGKVFLAGATTEIPIGTGAAVRIEQFILPNGKFDGISISSRIPA